MLHYLNNDLDLINDALFDFQEMTMHSPQWEDKLQQLLSMLHQHRQYQQQYLYPYLDQLFPNKSDLISYASRWVEYVLKARTNAKQKQPNEAMNRMAFVSGVKPQTIARAFKKQF